MNYTHFIGLGLYQIRKLKDVLLEVGTWFLAKKKMPCNVIVTRKQVLLIVLSQRLGKIAGTQIFSYSTIITIKGATKIKRIMCGHIRLLLIAVKRKMGQSMSKHKELFVNDMLCNICKNSKNCKNISQVIATDCYYYRI